MSASAARPASTRLATSALVLGVLSAALITVVSFISLVLAATALATGGAALARGENRVPALVGMLLAVGAVTVFVLEVSVGL